MTDDRFEQSYNNELNRLWNDLLDDTQDRHRYELLDSDTDFLVNFHARGSSKLPGPARDRAWRETLSRIEIILHKEVHSLYSTSTAPITANQPHSNGSITVPEAARYPDVAGQTRFWRRSLLAVAAGLLLVIGAALGGYLFFGSGNADNDSRSVIPAAVLSDATPTEEALQDRLLLQTELSAEVMPSGDDVTSGLVLHSYRSPEIGDTVIPFCCTAPIVQYIISGTYTVQAEKAFTVIRGDGKVVDVPANEEVSLLAGDGLVSPGPVTVKNTTDGEKTVELLSWVIADGDKEYDAWQPLGWFERSYDGFGVPNPPSPALVSLWKFTLDAREEWTAPAGSTVFRVTPLQNELGTPVPMGASTKSNDGVITNGMNESVVVYVLTLEPA